MRVSLALIAALLLLASAVDAHSGHRHGGRRNKRHHHKGGRGVCRNFDVQFDTRGKRFINDDGKSPQHYFLRAAAQVL